jgi:hypothetical protein
MEPVSEIVSFLEPRSNHVGGFEVGGDWSIGLGPYEGMQCYVVTTGPCWLVVEGANDAVRFEQVVCFLLPHGLPFRVCSDEALPPNDGRLHVLSASGGALIRLNDRDDVILLGGHSQLAGQHVAMLLDILPPGVRLRSEPQRETLRWSLDRMGRELADARQAVS